jgi:4-carboxymuconolactone decarboxylase
MTKNFHQALQKNNKKYKLLILPLISSAAVLRKKKVLKELLYSAKVKRVNPVKIYEVLLQTYLFAGFPSALISLKIASDFFPLNDLRSRSVKSDKNNGVENCKKIYGNKFDKLIKNVKEFSPELSEWLITEGYGKVMGREDFSLKEREMCIVAILCSMKYESQLYSHINGAFRLKNSSQEIKTIIVSLQQIAGRSVSDFGLEVFNSFLKTKNGKNS